MMSVHNLQFSIQLIKIANKKDKKNSLKKHIVSSQDNTATPERATCDITVFTTTLMVDLRWLRDAACAII